MKNLFTKSFLAFLFLINNTLQAQYTDVINSNKPGFSESPYSVGTGIYQFETGFFMQDTRIENSSSRPKSLGVDLLFRTSFFLEKLELNTQLTYQKDKDAFNNILNELLSFTMSIATFSAFVFALCTLSSTSENNNVTLPFAILKFSNLFS